MLVVVRTIYYMLYIILGRKYRNKIAARKHEKKIACYCQSSHLGFPTHMTTDWNLLLTVTLNSNSSHKAVSSSLFLLSLSTLVPTRLCV